MRKLLSEMTNLAQSGGGIINKAEPSVLENIRSDASLHGLSLQRPVGSLLSRRYHLVAVLTEVAVESEWSGVVRNRSSCALPVPHLAPLLPSSRVSSVICTVSDTAVLSSLTFRLQKSKSYRLRFKSKRLRATMENAQHDGSSCESTAPG